MSRLSVLSVVRHEEIIERLDQASMPLDFDPKTWSLHDADRLLMIAKRIQSQVAAYYAAKSERDRATGE